MALPFSPEPWDQLQARYPRALRPVFSHAKINRGAQRRPGEFRSHVFDTEEGIRLIVSRDLPIGEPDVLHISASLGGPGPLRDELSALPRGNERLDTFAFRAIHAWRRLAGQPDLAVQFIGYSGGLVPHWIVPNHEINTTGG